MNTALSLLTRITLGVILFTITILPREGQMDILTAIGYTLVSVAVVLWVLLLLRRLLGKDD